jgi:hypothetical protein
MTFENKVVEYFNSLQIEFEIIHTNDNITKIKTPNVTFQVTPLHSYYNTNCFGFSNFTIYEDLWNTREVQLKSRLHSLLQLNEKMHARLGLIRTIDKPTAERFLNHNHLMGYTKCATKLGLFFKDELFAVATFSAGRKMNRLQEDERSFELIAFASKNFVTVVGGLDKLVKHFIRLKNPADIMTYVDAEQGSITSYEKLGFSHVGTTSPQVFYLDKEGIRKKDLEQSRIDSFNNKGSHKLILAITK